MPPADTAPKLLKPGLVPGAIGGFVVWVAYNLWYYSFGGALIPGVSGGAPLPDYLLFFAIDVLFGARCGLIGNTLGQDLAPSLGIEGPRTQLAALFAAFLLSAAVLFIVNTLLILMFII